MADRAVAWFALASPKEQPRSASAGSPFVDAQALGAGEAERQAHRLGQVAGDRARLRRHPQRAAAPHLVAALADRILARGDDAEQRVQDRRAAGQLTRARQHEPAGPIVEERGVVDAQAARRGPRCSRARPSRSCRSCGSSSSARAPQRRAAATRPGPRTGRGRSPPSGSPPGSQRSRRVEPRGGRLRGVEVASSCRSTMATRSQVMRWRPDSVSCGRFGARAGPFYRRRTGYLRSGKSPPPVTAATMPAMMSWAASASDAGTRQGIAKQATDHAVTP